MERFVPMFEADASPCVFQVLPDYIHKKIERERDGSLLLRHPEFVPVELQ